MKLNEIQNMTIKDLRQLSQEQLIGIIVGIFMAKGELTGKIKRLRQ